MPMPVLEKPRVRSPSFPFISLREAVDRARAFFREEKQHAAPPQVAATYWGYSSLKSSGAPRTIAALRAYGLLEGEDEIRLTDRALALLRDETPDAEKRRLLQDAARLPPAHRVVWGRFGADLPSDATLSSFLVERLGFNPDSVEGFLRNYRETIEFAGLTADAAQGTAAPPPSPSPAPEPPAAALLELTERFPLMDGGKLEVRAPRKVTRSEAEQLRLFFELWLKTITAP
jgi:hypothetical protein